MVDILDYIDKMQEMYEGKPSSMVPGQRNMYNQGQLVQPNADGSRPGYAGDDETTKLAKEYQKVTGAKTKLANIKSRIRNNTITKELIDKYKSRGAYGSGFRGKEIEAVTNPKFYKTILSELNKVKKQKNKNVFFDYDDVIRTGKWYKNLRKKLGNLNEVDTDTIIKKVLSEEFPGSYYGKTGMRDFRRDKVVKAYLNYLDVNGSLDGGEKRLKELKIFQGTGKKQFRNINETFKEWTKGEFEVEGVDRNKLNPDQLKELKNWSPEYSTTKSVANEKQLKFLNDLNTNNPNLSAKEVRQKFFKKFPDVTEGAFNHRITHLTQLKNSGAYNQGGGSNKSFKWATKGERASWLKELLGLKFQGNYSSFINRGDKLLEQGLTKEANRLYNAAEKYFGSNGVFTKFEGQGEHPFSRIFGSGPIGNELKINSLVRGDLNSFKRLNFDEPVIQLLTEYNKNTTTPERRNKIKTLIEDKKKIMNYLTESPTEKGIVESVKFNYGPNKMSVNADVTDIDKVKKFNPEDYAKRGQSYLESFETKGKNLMDKSGKIIQKKLNPKLEQQIKNQFCPGNRKGGQPGTCDIGEAMDNMIKQTNAVKQGAIKGTEATRIANKASKVVRFGTGKGLGAVLGPLGIGAEAVFEVAMAVPGYGKGKSGKRLLGDSLLGLIPGVGQSAEEEFAKYATKDGMSQLDQQKIKDVNRFLELNESLPIAYKNIGKGRRGDPLAGAKTFNKQYDEYSPLYDQFVGGPPSESVSTAFAEQDRINQQIAADEAIRAQQRNIAGEEDFMAASGGRAGLSGGDTSGRPPESGPMSQGLRSLIKNGRKL